MCFKYGFRQRENQVRKAVESKSENRATNLSVKMTDALFNNIQIVTSQDPFAISDAINQALKTTKHQLRITAPWMGRGFVDRPRNLHLKGIDIKLLTRTPEKKDDRTFQAVESMKGIAKSEGWTVEVKFNSNLHVKMVIVDEKMCFVSSFNPTDSGIYYNHEWMCISEDPAFVRRHENYFDELWANPRNNTYQQVKTFYGVKTADGAPYRKKIAERIIGHFDNNGNKKIRKWKIVKEIQKLGYYENDIKSVLRDLVNDGVLYEPDYDSYRMVSDD